MPQRYVNDDVRAALLDAVRRVEAASAVEVVLAIRGRSAPYREAAWVAGAVAAIVGLAFVLFSPFPFSLAAIFFDPLLLGLLVGLLLARSPKWLRWATPASVQREAVVREARSVFLEKGVDRTRDRTGVLVYVSLLERRAEVVADRGVEDGVPPSEWEEAVAGIRWVVEAEGDGLELARAIGGLAAACAPTLPRPDDDENELPDEVCTS